LVAWKPGLFWMIEKTRKALIVKIKKGTFIDKE